MRVDGQETAEQVTACAADSAQGDLKTLGLSNCVAIEQLVDGLIGGDKGQAVGQFEALLAERAVAADAGGAQCRLVNQLQSQAAVHMRTALTRPTLKQIPRAQTQALGHEKEKTGQSAGSLVGQQLADATFHTALIAGLYANGAFGALRFDGGGQGPAGVEFFFEAPIR